MSLYGALDKTKHLDEFNDPLPNGSGGMTTPAARRALARDNIGFAEGLIAGVEARFEPQPVIQITATAVNTSATTTGAALIGGLITSTTAAAVAMTLPLATDMNTAMVAQYGTVEDGDSIIFHVRATGANALTVTTNTGWTLSGDMVIETATTGAFLVRRTSATTYTVDRWL